MHCLTMSCADAAKIHGEKVMKIWNTPQVREESVGLEVTSYMSAEIDII